MRAPGLGPEIPREEQHLEREDGDGAQFANGSQTFHSVLRRREVHHRLFRGLLSRQLTLHLPFAHHHDPIGEREHFGQVARDDEDGDPGFGLAADQFVNLEFRADVHPFGRLVEQQHARGRRQPLGGHDLLLVAAAQRVGQRVETRGLDSPLAHQLLGLGAFLAVVHEDVAANGSSRQRQVVSHRQVEQQPLTLPLLRHQRDAGTPRLPRGAQLDRRATDANLAR